MHLSPGIGSCCLLDSLQVFDLGVIHTGGLVVADTSATNHMLSDALTFISYNRVMDLSICMGNNSFVPAFGRGTAIFSLNGKRILV
jgi:hypothetical protein